MAWRSQDQLALALIAALAVFGLAAFGRSSERPAIGNPPRFVIDPNQASQAELLLLPRVGPSLAGAIIAEREKHPFETPRDIGRTRGIGEKTLPKLLPYLKIEKPSGEDAEKGRSE